MILKGKGNCRMADKGLILEQWEWQKSDLGSVWHKITNDIDLQCRIHWQIPHIIGKKSNWRSKNYESG